MTTVQSINVEQARAILNEALTRGMYEAPDGLSGDEEILLRDATSLVEQAQRAREIGNKSEAVGAILFIYEVDQKPLSETQQPEAQAPPEGNGQSGSSVDVSQLSDEMLDGMIAKLESYVATPPVEAELNTLRVTREERRKGTASGQEQTQAPASEAAASPPVGGDEGGGQDQDSAPAPADASAEPAGEAPASSAEGSPGEAEPDEEAGRRAELEAQITLPMLGVHELTATGIGDLSIEDLQYVVEHPNGPPKGQFPEEGAVDVEAPQERAGLMEPTISKERESLEEQVTGPMLKAYGRGRVDVPKIGDNELELMIAHPDGRVTKQQLEGARSQDQKDFNPVSGQMETATTGTASATTTVEPQATESTGDGFLPPDETSQEQSQEAAPEPPATPEEAQAPTPPAKPSAGADRAQQIIQRENFPIPAEIEGDPPILPNDISKVSDDDLFSYHGRFHACMVRINWIISQEEDELHDVAKMLRVKERDVKRDYLAGIEGKKPTKDVVEAEVYRNEEVSGLADRMDEVKRVIAKLTVLRDNWKSDVSVCSRQWSMRSREDEKAPNR